MKKAILIALVILLTFLHSAIAKSESFSCGEYALTPPFLVDAAAPSTTIILDNSASMKEHAYQELNATVKRDSDNITHEASYGYNSTDIYYGYFDPNSNYKYDDSGNFFYNSTDTSGTWSGNFLNWATMLKIDIVKKALTGGAYNNATSTYTTSVSDRIDGRGRVHLLDTSSNTHATPYGSHGLIAIIQDDSNPIIRLHEIVDFNATSN